MARERSGRSRKRPDLPQGVLPRQEVPHGLGRSKGAGREMVESKTSKTGIGRNSRMSVGPSSPGRWPLSLCWNGEPTPSKADISNLVHEQGRQAAGTDSNNGFWAQTELGLNSEGVSIPRITCPYLHIRGNNTFVHYRMATSHSSPSRLTLW